MKLVIPSKKVSLAKPVFNTIVLTGTKYAAFKFFNACIQYQSFHNWTQNKHLFNWVNTTWDFPSTPVQMLAFFAVLFSLVEFPSNSKNSLNLTVAGHTAPLLLILKQLTASYWKFSLVSDGPERMPLSLEDRNMPSFFKKIRTEIGIYECFLTEGLILLGYNGVHYFWICFLGFLLFLLERPFLVSLSHR